MQRGETQMLMTTPSHVRLGIAEEELEALIEVRRKLAEGEIVKADYEDHRQPGLQGFNMQYAAIASNDSDSCGSVACIGGWMAAHIANRRDWLGATMYVSTHKSNSLHILFYPFRGDGTEESLAEKMKAITVEQAIQAIDNFLAGATLDPWAGVLQR
jgi:hypothetical protein